MFLFVFEALSIGLNVLVQCFPKTFDHAIDLALNGLMPSFFQFLTEMLEI